MAVSDMGGLPRETAYALARSGDVAAAVTVVENARARELGRLFERDQADLSALDSIAPHVAATFRTAAGRVATIEMRQRASAANDFDEARQLRAAMSDAQAQFASAVQEIRAVPGFAGFAQPSVDVADA